MRLKLSEQIPTVEQLQARSDLTGQMISEGSIACDFISFHWRFHKETKRLLDLALGAHSCDSPNPPNEDICDNLHEIGQTWEMQQADLEQMAEDAGCDTNDW